MMEWDEYQQRMNQAVPRSMNVPCTCTTGYPGCPKTPTITCIGNTVPCPCDIDFVAFTELAQDVFTRGVRDTP